MSAREALLVGALKGELEFLWDDLADDLRMARNGYWSIATESTVERILTLSEVVGVTPPGKIPIPLLRWGVYGAVCQRLGVVYEKEDLSAFEEHFGDPKIARAVEKILAMEKEEEG